MINNVYFSIIIPTSNRSHDLNETLNKLNQSTFRSFEVILIDNNSIDNTKEIAKKSLGIAADVCIYTNHNIIVEEIKL